MKRLYQILLPLLGLFFYRVELTEFWPLKIRAMDYKIMDGDTLKVRFGSIQETVRVIPIDAPEMGQRFLTSSQDAGEFSKRCLEKLLKGRRVEVSWVKRDIYQRLLGELWADGENVSKLMVQNGCSTLYVYSQFSSKKERGEWLRWQRLAQQERRGLWKWGVMSPYHYRKQKKGRPFGRPYQRKIAKRD